MAPASRRTRIALGTLAVLLGAALAGSVPAWRHVFAQWERDGRLASWANRRADRLRISWHAARSPWPGRLEVDGLRVAGRSDRLAWEITADRATGYLSPLGLLFRELGFTAIRAQGVEIRVSRFAVAAAGRPGSGEHPRIAGFETPAPAPRPGGAHAWSFSFRDLELRSVRELWVDDRHYTGEAEAHGGLEIQRRTTAEVLPSRLSWAHLRLVADGLTVADEVGGEADLRIHPWRYRGAGLAEVAPRVEGRIRLSGRIEPDEVIHYLFGSWPWLTIESRPSRLDATLRVSRGEFGAGSRLRLDSPGGRVRFLGFEARGDGRLEARVNAALGGPARLESRLDLTDWELGRPGEAPVVTGRGLAFVARAEHPRDDGPPHGIDLSLDLGDATVPDLRFLNELIPGAAGVVVESGAATIDGKLRFDTDERSGAGSVHVRSSPIALSAGGRRLAGDVDVQLHLADPTFSPPAFSVDGSRVSFHGGAATSVPPDPTAKSWWGELSLPSGRIDLSRPFGASGRFDARLADTRPLVALYEMRRDLPGWAERLLTLEGVSATGDFTWSPGRLRIDDALAPLPNGQLRATLDLDRTERTGRLLLVWRRLAVGLELAPDGRHLHLAGAREWYDSAEDPASPEAAKPRALGPGASSAETGAGGPTG